MLNICDLLCNQQFYLTKRIFIFSEDIKSFKPDPIDSSLFPTYTPVVSLYNQILTTIYTNVLFTKTVVLFVGLK